MTDPDRRRIQLDAADMKALLARAKESGTVERWADIACEWMDAAEAEIARLRDAAAGKAE